MYFVVVAVAAVAVDRKDILNLNFPSVPLFK